MRKSIRRRRNFNSISVLASCLLLIQHEFSSAQITYTAVVLSQTNVSVLSGFGCSFGQYVGSAYDGSSRAIMWSGSFSNAIVLHPPGAPESSAYGVSDGQQVGYFLPDPLTPGHAALWYGTAESMVDLHSDAPNVDSVALAVHNGVQVGYGGSPYHALLWRGSAASVVDLHPTNANPSIQPYYETFATCVAGSFQGGYGTKSDKPRALMWTGTRQSVIDLHPGYWGSKASGISCYGTAVGFVFIASCINCSLLASVGYFCRKPDCPPPKGAGLGWLANCKKNSLCPTRGRAPDALPFHDARLSLTIDCGAAFRSRTGEGKPGARRGVADSGQTRLVTLWLLSEHRLGEVGKRHQERESARLESGQCSQNH